MPEAVEHSSGGTPHACAAAAIVICRAAAPILTLAEVPRSLEAVYLTLMADAEADTDAGDGG